ncbi:hypothetical protein [Flavobacterium sp. U410]
MKKISFVLILFTVLVFVPNVVLSSEKESVFADQKQAQTKLENQVEHLLNNSLNYKNYKVVDKQTMFSFKNELESFLNISNQARVNFQKELEGKMNQISALDESLQSLQTENIQLKNEKHTINFLGMAINKYAYITMLWGLFFTSLLVIGFFALKFVRANEVTKSSKSILSNLEDEYEAFRRSSIEREQKLRRELFNEMKKVKELKQAS